MPRLFSGDPLHLHVGTDTYLAVVEEVSQCKGRIFLFSCHTGIQSQVQLIRAQANGTPALSVQPPEPYAKEPLLYDGQRQAGGHTATQND